MERLVLIFQIFLPLQQAGGTYNSGTDTLFIDEITNNPTDWRVTPQASPEN